MLPDPTPGTPRRLQRVTLAALAGLVAATIASGCGDVQAAYEGDVRPIGRFVDESLETVAAAPQGVPDDVALRRLAADLNEAANQLDDIDPPAEVADEHASLEVGMRSLSREVGRLAASQDRGSDSARAAALLAFPRRPAVRAAFAKISSAREGFRDEGYEVFPDGA